MALLLFGEKDSQIHGPLYIRKLLILQNTEKVLPRNCWAVSLSVIVHCNFPTYPPPVPKKAWQEHPEVTPTVQAVAGHWFHLLENTFNATAWFSTSELHIRWCKLLEKLPKNAHFWQAFIIFLLCSGLLPALSGATQSVFDGLLNDWIHHQKTVHKPNLLCFHCSTWAASTLFHV